jgi:hypothetical protein
MRAGRLEVPLPMQAAQVALAAVVLALSLLPGLWLGLLGRALAGVPVPPLPTAAGWSVLAFGPATGAYAPLLLVAAAAWGTVLGFVALGRGGATRRVGTWMGGVPEGVERAPVEAWGFFVPLREPMRGAYPSLLFRPVPLPRWVLPAVDADRWLFRPAARAGRRVGEALQRAHSGTAHRYIVWQLFGALVLIVLLALQRS